MSIASYFLSLARVSRRLHTRSDTYFKIFLQGPKMAATWCPQIHSRRRLLTMLPPAPSTAVVPMAAGRGCRQMPRPDWGCQGCNRGHQRIEMMPKQLQDKVSTQPLLDADWPTGPGERGRKRVSRPCTSQDKKVRAAFIIFLYLFMY
jgi:hypothetical protein